MSGSMRATCRSGVGSVALLLTGAILAALAVGCATGGRGGHDAGVRRDAGAPAFDAGPRLDAPSLDAPRPDVGERPDVPVPPGTDTGPTIVRDSGSTFDGGPGFDAGPPPECTTAADCSDGVPCNGIERCEFGRCNPGVAVTCDDGVACTTDSCFGGTCSYTPSDPACGAGMRCTATGCMSTSSCSETPCRLVPPQCGCPAGQSCYLNGTARTCAATGTIPEGNSCAGVSDCAGGTLCVNFSATGTGQMCSRMCGADGDCASGGLCIGQLSDGMGGALPGVRLCTRSCDPIAQTGCAAGLECTLFQEAAGARRLYRDCTGSAGTGTIFDPCVTEDDCAAGYGCFDVSGFGPECTHWCNAGAGTGCTFGTCFGFGTPLIIGGVEYGVCG